MNYVFLVEEESMRVFLNIFLTNILPEGTFQVVPHEGKADLKKSIVREMCMKKYNGNNPLFIVMIDKDSNDCIKLKAELDGLCRTTNQNYKIRIACHELEAWHLGDLSALSRAYGKDFTGLSQKEKFRQPDKLGNPAQVLEELLNVKRLRKIENAREMATAMRASNLSDNKSHSFQVFLRTVGIGI